MDEFTPEAPHRRVEYHMSSISNLFPKQELNNKGFDAPLTGESVLFDDRAKHLLYEQIMADKREKSNIGANLGMYCPLGNPVFDIDEITGSAISAMENNSAATQMWSEDFGRVLVCVNPDNVGIEIVSTSDPRQKRNVLIFSSRLFAPNKIIGTNLISGPNIIVMNEQPATIEGLTTSYLHLLDQVVWERFLILKRESPNANKVDLFARAVSRVRAEGVSLFTASEDEILNLFVSGELIPRPYPSRAIKSLPFILGGVGFNHNISHRPVINSARPRMFLPLQHLINSAEKDITIPDVFIPVCMVTMAKPLHIGHLLSLSIAELASASGQVVLADNDLGPRVESMVVQLSQNLGISFAEAVGLMQDNRIQPQDIVNAYRQSKKSGAGDKFVDEKERQLLLRSGVLQVLEDEMRKNLSLGGFDTFIIQESRAILNFGIAVQNLWEGIGFNPVLTNKGIVLFEKEGRTSIVSTCLSTIAQVASCSGIERPGVLIVDAGE